MVTESLAVAGGVIAVLLCLSAFFSASEIAIFSLDRHRAAESNDDPRAAALARLREDPHRLLVTILVGNNLVNISMASLATATLAVVYGPGAGVTIATAGMSVLILVFGEIAPKSYGVANADRLALRVARPIVALQYLLYPLVVVFETVVDVINRLAGTESADAPELTRAELTRLVATGERVGAIDRREREMVEGIFGLGETTVREVMVPRHNVVAVDAETPLGEIVGVGAEARVSRVPVHRGDLDDTVGVVDIRDAERALREDLSLDDVLQPTLAVPDSRRVDALLAEMQAERLSLVTVVDEYGEVEGIVTVEDIVEEIVGDVFEVGEERFLNHTDDGLLVKGEVTVGEVNDVLGTALPRGPTYETVAGLINAELGRLGEAGDSVALPEAGASLTVEAVERNRIRTVRVRRIDGPVEGEDGDDGAARDDAAGAVE